jgi:hypothetical protein
MFGGPVDPATVTVARALGARHAAQGFVEVAAWPKWRRAGVFVDAAHSLTASAGAVSATRWRRVAFTDSVVAAAFAFAGWIRREPTGTPQIWVATRKDWIAKANGRKKAPRWEKQLRIIPEMASTGLLGSVGQGRQRTQVVQARHEETAAFEAARYAKFFGQVGVCAETGPGRRSEVIGDRRASRRVRQTASTRSS